MKSTVNSRIRLLRTQLNLSQTEFSALADISHSLLSKIEVGAHEPSAKVLEKISEVWNVPIDWLLIGKGELVFDKVEKNGSVSDPYKDVLYKELKEQIKFYRDLLTQMAGGKPNFRKALNYTGLNNNKQLRVSRLN